MILSDDYLLHDDASSGFLKPGDVGTIDRDDKDDKPFRVAIDGNSWFYNERALRLAPVSGGLSGARLSATNCEVEVNKTLVFSRSSSYPYPPSCTNDARVVLLEASNGIPPAHVRWASGHTFWVNWEDLCLPAEEEAAPPPPVAAALPSSCAALRPPRSGSGQTCEHCRGCYQMCFGSYGSRSSDGLWVGGAPKDLTCHPESPNKRWCCQACEDNSKKLAATSTYSSAPVAAIGAAATAASAATTSSQGSHTGEWRDSNKAQWCSLVESPEGMVCQHNRNSSDVIIAWPHWSCCGCGKDEPCTASSTSPSPAPPQVTTAAAVPPQVTAAAAASAEAPTAAAALGFVDLINSDGAVMARTQNPNRGDEGKYYCGRRLGRDRIPGSDGQCGPNNGPQCSSCLQWQPINSDGAVMARTQNPNRGDEGKYYCGRRLGRDRIPGSDGQCGPNNGPQCPSCMLTDATAPNFAQCPSHHALRPFADEGLTITCDACQKSVPKGGGVACRACDYDLCLPCSTRRPRDRNTRWSIVMRCIGAGRRQTGGTSKSNLRSAVVGPLGEIFGQWQRAGWNNQRAFDSAFDASYAASNQVFLLVRNVESEANVNRCLQQLRPRVAAEGFEAVKVQSTVVGSGRVFAATAVGAAARGGRLRVGELVEEVPGSRRDGFLAKGEAGTLATDDQSSVPFQVVQLSFAILSVCMSLSWNELFFSLPRHLTHHLMLVHSALNLLCLIPRYLLPFIRSIIDKFLFLSHNNSVQVRNNEGRTHWYSEKDIQRYSKKPTVGRSSVRDSHMRHCKRGKEIILTISF